jgi:hypothetical protein
MVESSVMSLFGYLIVLQFIVICSHDLVDIPGWTHGRQVRGVIGSRKLWLVTAINAIFPGLAAGTALVYWGHAAPPLASTYWLVYCAITVGSAIGMWYVPYFFGTTEERKREYEQMYSGTRQVLPKRNDNPRPNLLHVLFHVLFVTNLVLSAAVWTRTR